MDDPRSIDLMVKLCSYVIGTFWFLCFFNGLTNKSVKPLKIPERFDLGYIDDPPEAPPVVAVELPKAKKKEKKGKKKKMGKNASPKAKPIPLPERQQHPAYHDCVDALVGLGERRGSAKRTVNKFLTENPRTKTVQEFLTEVF